MKSLYEQLQEDVGNANFMRSSKINKNSEIKHTGSRGFKLQWLHSCAVEHDELEITLYKYVGNFPRFGMKPLKVL